jgi:hypothetical protein
MRQLTILGLKEMCAGSGQLLSGHDAAAGPGPSATAPRAYKHIRRIDMKSRTLVGGIFALIWFMAVPVWAAEYRLEVANIDAQLFSSYEGQGSSWTSQNEPMGRLEARLDQQQFSPAAILPGHHVELLEDPAYGGITPTRVSLLPATRHQDWSTYAFEGNPGDTVAFVVRTDMYAWQQVWDVAANPGGTLRRLSIGGPGIFGNSSREVPQVSEDFLANAVDRGTFPQWVAQHAKAVDGMSFVVGQGDNPSNDPDRLYVLLKLPPESHTFKVVVGWKDNQVDRMDRAAGR